MATEKETNDWTTASVKRKSLAKVQDEAHRRRKQQLDNAAERLVLDEVIQLGIDALRRSRTA